MARMSSLQAWTTNAAAKNGRVKSSPPFAQAGPPCDEVKTDKSTGIGRGLGGLGLRPVQQATEPVVCTLDAVQQRVRPGKDARVSRMKRFVR